jgi:hypothetical protein
MSYLVDSGSHALGHAFIFLALFFELSHHSCMCLPFTMPHRSVKVTGVRKGSGVSAIIEGEQLLVYNKSKLLFRLESWQIWRQAERDVRFQAVLWQPKHSRWQLLVLELPTESKFEALRQWLKQSIATNQEQRPHRLRVYINPVGGRKKALPNYNKIKSLLTMAGLEMEEVVTTHANHCREELAVLDISPYDGIIIAGGDGLLAEAIHGLLERSDGLQLPLGLVPSGKPVAYSCSQLTCGARVGY